MSVNRYNEFDYAEKMIKKGFMSKYRRYELKVLSKYYKEQGLSYKEIEEKIQEFCVKYLDEFDDVRHFRLINHVMNYVRKKNSKLIVIDYVPISKSEINYIDNIPLENHHKKFLFCLYVRFKLDKMLFEYCNDGKEYFIDYFSHEVKRQKEVFKMTQLKGKKYNMNSIIKDLYDNGVLDVLDSGKLRLNFLNDVNDDGPAYIKVDTISVDYAGYFYDLYCGEKYIKKCVDCGIIIKTLGARKKYCKDCFKEMRREYNRIKQKKYKMYK